MELLGAVGLVAAPGSGYERPVAGHLLAGGASSLTLSDTLTFSAAMAPSVEAASRAAAKIFAIIPASPVVLFNDAIMPRRLVNA